MVYSMTLADGRGARGGGRRGHEPLGEADERPAGREKAGRGEQEEEVHHGGVERGPEAGQIGGGRDERP